MVASSTQTDDSVDLREYLGVLARRRWTILFFTVACTGLALLYSFTAEPVYTGVTEILLQPPASSSLRPDQLVSLETEARVVTSADVAQAAAADLQLDTPLPALLKRVSVETTPETLVLDISFDAAGPRGAALGANAFAEAYLDFKQGRAQQVLDDRREQVQVQIDELELQQANLEARLEGLEPGTEQYQRLSAERDSLESSINALTFQKLSIPLFPEETVTIIFPATPPTEPSSPKHVLNLAMGLVLGLFIGLIVGFARDRVDDKVGERGDLEDLTTVLATIPHAVIPGDGRPRLITDEQPHSPAAEAYRSLRTSVMAMRRQSGDSVFAIASPVLGDGKSTTTANLAAALSHADKRVLVISADLRRPSLHAFFGKANDVGLAEVLLGEVRFNNAVETISPTLVLLPSGAPPARPAEILQSQAMRELIRRERERYDFILIDCPPVLGIADTVIVAPFVDTILLVARAEKTKRSLFVEAIEQLGQVGAAVGGGIINDVATSRGGYSYSYGPKERKRGLRRRGRGRPAQQGSGSSSKPTPISPAPSSNGADDKPKPEGRARGSQAGTSSTRPKRSGA